MCSGDVPMVTSTVECEYEDTLEGVLCILNLTTNSLQKTLTIVKGKRVIFMDDNYKVFNTVKVGGLAGTPYLFNGV